MFESLDDAKQKALLKPWNLIAALFLLFVSGFKAGLLVAKRNWDVLEWFQAGVFGLLFLMAFAPTFHEFCKFLRDRELKDRESD
jgi:hypothetical protein